MDVATIILAGGEGKRIGIPKVRLSIYGIPLYLFSLRYPTRKLFVTLRNRIPRLPPDVELVIDRGLGPALAIKEALKRISEEYVVIRPIDMPFLRRSTVSQYIGRGIVVFASDKIHRVASIRPREELSIESPRVRDMFKGKSYSIIRLDHCEGLNINTLEDLLAGVKCFEEHYGSIDAFAKREP